MLVQITPAQLKYLQFLEKHKVKEEEKMFLTQNQAFKRFGQANVIRWAERMKVKQYRRPNTVEYRMSELLTMAEKTMEI